MDMDRLRQWLIEKGISPEELDEFIESPIVRDLGEGLTLSLINDEMIGMDIIMLLMRVEELEMRIMELEVE